LKFFYFPLSSFFTFKFFHFVIILLFFFYFPPFKEKNFFLFPISISSSLLKGFFFFIRNLFRFLFLKNLLKKNYLFIFIYKSTYLYNKKIYYFLFIYYNHLSTKIFIFTKQNYLFPRLLLFNFFFVSSIIFLCSMSVFL
jgi:hypothetical protein